jgi:hypothetical protein
MVLIANNQASEVLKPGEQPFDLPSTLITTKLPTVLSPVPTPLPAVGGNQIYAALIQKALIKPIAVVGLITNEAIRSILSKTAVKGCLHQLYFMGRSALNVSGDRKTSSVCDGHDLGAFAALGLADSKTPFFAGTKVPSMKASRISIPPRSDRSSASSWTMRLKMPDRAHCWNRLWQVWYGGYRGGKSFQGAPVRKIHNIPFRTSRGSRSFLPRASLLGFPERIMGSIRFHCSLVSSILILFHNQDLMSRFFLR